MPEAMTFRGAPRALERRHVPPNHALINVIPNEESTADRCDVAGSRKAAT